VGRLRRRFGNRSRGLATPLGPYTTLAIEQLPVQLPLTSRTASIFRSWSSPRQRLEGGRAPKSTPLPLPLQHLEAKYPPVTRSERHCSRTSTNGFLHAHEFELGQSACSHACSLTARIYQLCLCYNPPRLSSSTVYAMYLTCEGLQCPSYPPCVCSQSTTMHINHRGKLQRLSSEHGTNTTCRMEGIRTPLSMQNAAHAMQR
jgi:hypothetical protein